MLLIALLIVLLVVVPDTAHYNNRGVLAEPVFPFDPFVSLFVVCFAPSGLFGIPSGATEAMMSVWTSPPKIQNVERRPGSDAHNPTYSSTIDSTDSTNSTNIIS